MTRSPFPSSFAALLSLSLALFGTQVLVSAVSHQVSHVSLPRLVSSTTTTIPVAQVNVPISGSVKKREAKKASLNKILTSTLNRRATRSSRRQLTAPIAGSDFDEEYLVNVTVGPDTYALIVDTGSSDTWLAQVNFTCINLASQQEPESECAFGPLYDPSGSSTYTEIPDENFNITYGDGEFLLGTAGKESVTIGGLTVPDQEIGIVTRAAWFGDGINSGLVGLAFPGLTSIYPGTNPSADSFPSATQYNPFPFQAAAEGLLDPPFFSIALNRGTFSQEENDPFDPNLGFISFGGLAPVAVTNTTASAPVQGYSLRTFDPSNATTAVDFYYTVDVQGLSFTGANSRRLGNTVSDNVIIDTGTTLNYVPTNVINAFAAAVVPPAEFSDDIGAYVVDCDATVPEFFVRIAGTTFTIDPKDNILPIGTDDSGAEVCILATDDGGPNEEGNIFILGDTFIHNVVVTFNVETKEVTFTQREPY